MRFQEITDERAERYKDGEPSTTVIDTLQELFQPAADAHAAAMAALDAKLLDEAAEMIVDRFPGGATALLGLIAGRWEIKESGAANVLLHDRTIRRTELDRASAIPLVRALLHKGEADLEHSGGDVFASRGERQAGLIVSAVGALADAIQVGAADLADLMNGDCVAVPVVICN